MLRGPSRQPSARAAPETFSGSGSPAPVVRNTDLRARIGAGGGGRGYLAFSPGGRALAVKVVRPDYAQDEEFRRRFRKEIEAALRVQGLYTAPVVDADSEAKLPWPATPYVPPSRSAGAPPLRPRTCSRSVTSPCSPPPDAPPSARATRTPCSTGFSRAPGAGRLSAHAAHRRQAVPRQGPEEAARRQRVDGVREEADGRRAAGRLRLLALARWPSTSTRQRTARAWRPLVEAPAVSRFRS